MGGEKSEDVSFAKTMVSAYDAMEAFGGSHIMGRIGMRRARKDFVDVADFYDVSDDSTDKRFIYRELPRKAPSVFVEGGKGNGKYFSHKAMEVA